MEKEKEISEVIIKVSAVNGKERYEVIGRRSDYVEVVASDVSTIENELIKVVGFCKVLKTPDEKTTTTNRKAFRFCYQKLN